MFATREVVEERDGSMVLVGGCIGEVLCGIGDGKVCCPLYCQLSC